MPEPLIYTVRPDGTALWLPKWITDKHRIRKGQKLTEDQFSSQDIQEIISLRLAAQATNQRKKKP